MLYSGTMKKIPIVTTISSTVDAIQKACKQSHFSIISQHLHNYTEVLAAFHYEMPEIKIIDFGDPAINAERCLTVVKDDPWLLFGGVIAITNSQEQKATLMQRKEPNFLFVLTRKEFEQYIAQIIKILNHHEHFLVNRGMNHPVNDCEHGSFTSETDPFEHGKCNISYQEKTEWLKEGKDVLDLIRIKRMDPAIGKRKILITYDISPERTRITILDEGDGFDWRSALDKPFEPGLHGMGIKMSQTFVQQLYYNDAGNEVSFEVPNQKNVTNLTPAILKDQEIFHFDHLQLVCRQNDDSSNLFYIRSGRYAVYVDNALLTVLTPADIFIGEMAFLTNDKRSATIVSIGKGTLVKVPKMQFMQLIETYPHYGVFLSRLLAERLVRQSRESASLKNELKALKHV